MTVHRLFDDMPARIAKLPRSDKGFPIPFFAEENNGVRDFRVVSHQKMVHAVRFKKCWVCGEPLGRFMAFVIGPMCAINRTISDPPSHRECAIFSAKNCPFLSSPLAKRRAEGLPEESREAAGVMIKRNPGAVGVWVTKEYRPFQPHRGNPGLLFEIGEPTELLWFADGREASRERVLESIRTGLPLLIEEAKKDGEEALADLRSRHMQTMHLLPMEGAA